MDESTDKNLLEYVFGFRERLRRASEIACENLEPVQKKMKSRFDRTAKSVQPW